MNLFCQIYEIRLDIFIYFLVILAQNFGIDHFWGVFSLETEADLASESPSSRLSGCFIAWFSWMIGGCIWADWLGKEFQGK